VVIPAGAALGVGKVSGKSAFTAVKATKRFTVT
jgi:hypothetical protein